MASKQTLPIKDILAAIDMGAKDVWDELSDDEKKQVGFWLLNRYVSSVSGTREQQELAILKTNEYYNKNWNVLGTKHPSPQCAWLGWASRAARLGAAVRLGAGLAAGAGLAGGRPAGRALVLLRPGAQSAEHLLPERVVTCCPSGAGYRIGNGRTCCRPTCWPPVRSQQPLACACTLRQFCSNIRFPWI